MTKKERLWEALSRNDGRRWRNTNIKSSWTGIVIRRNNALHSTNMDPCPSFHPNHRIHLVNGGTGVLHYSDSHTSGT
jgi:hypothetical protein